eukprot:c3291_g2_i1 orf=2-352(-)
MEGLLLGRAFPLVGPPDCPNDMHGPDCILNNSILKKTKETLKKEHRKEGEDHYQDTCSLARKELNFLDQGTPFVKNIISLLHKYTKEKNLDHALHLHVYILNIGLEGSCLFGNLLVS